MALLPRENWILIPRKYGMPAVLIGTEKNGQERRETLSKGHMYDAPAETTVQWRYCGGDAAVSHASGISLLPKSDYCPTVSGHGQIFQGDADAIRAEGEERLADVLDKIISAKPGDLEDPIAVLVTRGALRGHQTLPLDLIFLGGAEALTNYSQEQRIEAAAERLVARGGTVAS